MTYVRKTAALALAAALTACQQQPTDNATIATNDAPPAATGTSPTAASPEKNASVPAPPPPSSATGDEAAAPSPSPPLTDDAERSETGARAVLLDFARALELKRFNQAYALLSPGDKQRWSRSEFGAIFKDLGRITVAAPTGTLEGAAGSSYYSAPLTITSSDKDGRPVRIEGEAVLRRVNDVDGATAAQLRWHMDKLTLNWTH